MNAMSKREEETGKGSDVIRMEVGQEEMRKTVPGKPQSRHRLHGSGTAVEERSRFAPLEEIG